ncbi:MAG: phosphate ABC transporter substrate-binding protein PstS [Bifidobacteriaceae bacterium]|jgi:phosphate transport system substrate-binding protein|nr:phosphate ABC transporter substrate-binding protein PstS [Bifidobacteriaceae bacterium]
MTKVAATATAAGMILAALAGCAANEETPGDGKGSGSPAAKLSGTIDGAGASSQSAAQEAWRGGFAKLQSDVVINYDPTGSGTGREQFTEGGVAFVGTDAPFSLDDVAAGFGSCADGSGLVEVPVYISPIVVAFNLDGITELNLAPKTIADIFLGKIAKWNDPAITADNPGVNLPDTNVAAVHRADKSGTTENFTDWLAANAKDAWPHEPAEEWPVSGGEAAEKTQGVVATVTSTPGAVGYVDAGQASGLGWAAIKVGGAWVSASPEGAAKAVGESSLQEGRADTDVVYDLNRTTEAAGAYPLILVSYLGACEKYKDAEQGKLVAGYFQYVTSEDGQAAAAANAGSAPLTSEEGLSAKVSSAVASIG